MLDWLKNIFSAKSASPQVNLHAAPARHDMSVEESLRHKESGDALLDQANWEAAASQYWQALALQPHYAEAHGNLALVLMRMQQLDAAREHSLQALAIKPELFNSHYLLATIARQQGRDGDAILHLHHAIAVKPDFDVAYHELGVLYAHRSERAGAQAAYRHVLTLDPDHVAVLFNLAGLLEFDGNRQDAIACYRKALALQPTFNSARLAMLHQLMQTCDWHGLLEEVDRVRQAVRDMPADIETCDSPFSFLALPGATAAEQKRCAEKWTLTQYRQQVQMRNTLGFDAKRTPNSKPHIGYLSSDFCDHATARLMAEVFELHDRDQFRITAYSYSPADGSAMSARMHAAFDAFVDISALSDIEVAQRIYNDHVDILVDLKGYTGDSRSAILALCPAPIQVNYLGYPGTMGAGFVDYLIADRFVIPDEERQHYTENTAYLPHCYQPNDRTRARAANPGRTKVGLPENGIVFCCFNQTYKITPEMFAIWCDLLNEVPGSVLWLIASNEHTQGNLQREAMARGVAPERLIFAPRVSADAHLARQQCADIFLDTIPYNAHTTCSDALWMGLPVITLAGDTFSSRVAGSLLTALGVPELITYRAKDYHALALQLARDDVRRAELRTKIASLRDTSPLFDSLQFTRDLEQVYQQMLTSQSEVAKRISVVIVSPPGYAHSHAFDEVAECLMLALRELGYTVRILYDQFDRHGLNIIFGANLLRDERVGEVPNKSIIYNLEQVYPESPWMTKTMLNLFSRFEVWDYSQRNVDMLRAMVPGILAKFVRLGYMPQMTRIPQDIPHDIDVLFYGSLNVRRSAVIDALRQRGVRVEAAFGVYGAARDALIARAKIVLNMRLYDSDIFEIVRVSYLLANRKVVVSEWSEQTDMEADFKEAVALACYDDLVETCMQLLADDAVREALAARGFAVISARDEKAYLAQALA